MELTTRSRVTFAAPAPLAVLVALTACGPARPAPAAPVPEHILALEARVHELVNRHRAEQGLDPLRHDAALARIARDHSQAMARGDASFSHDQLERRVRHARNAAPVFYLGETLATVRPANDRAPAIALARWLRSDVHKRVLEGCFDRAAVGIAIDDTGTAYITHLLARTAGARVDCR